MGLKNQRLFRYKVSLWPHRVLCLPFLRNLLGSVLCSGSRPARAGLHNEVSHQMSALIIPVLPNMRMMSQSLQSKARHPLSHYLPYIFQNVYCPANANPYPPSGIPSSSEGAASVAWCAGIPRTVIVPVIGLCCTVE